MQDTSHVMECLKRFLTENRIRNEEEEEEEDATYNERCKNFRSEPRALRNRSMDDGLIGVGFYDSVFEEPDRWQVSDDGVRFDERSGLGSDVNGIVKSFLQSKNERWFHVMVKDEAFHTFVREMNTIRHTFTVLPFWCLCDGGRLQTHRHMIVACRNVRVFKKVWKGKVKFDWGPSDDNKNKHAKRCVEITNAYHLVRTIAYVSRPPASCDRGIPEESDEREDEGGGSHFYINRPISEFAISFLCTLFRGGIEELLSEQNRSKDVVEWEELADRRQYQWTVPIEKTGWKFLNCVIPVDRMYEPTESESDFYLHLLGDEKLYFKRNEELISVVSSDDDWYAYQASRGNTFRRLGKKPYVLSRKQQNSMNQIKRMEEKVKNRFDARWKLEIEALKLENEALKKKINDMTMESLMKELNTVKAQNLKLESQNLKLESQNLKLESQYLKLESQHLKLESQNMKLENDLNVARDMLRMYQNPSVN